MKIKNDRPIGVFDSGLGGLTVVRELKKLLPNESIVYVGDTARVPYGTKSADTIRRYALQIAFFLLQKKVKAIVVACNSVSAVAMKALNDLPIPVVGVIEPGARAAVMATENMRIGVIGTKATITSGAYKKAIKKYSTRARVWEKFCPLFVPLVEEGWVRHAVTTAVAKEYLAEFKPVNLDTLVLGCTHYPLLKEPIRRVMGPRVRLIDSAAETAKEVKDLLKKKNLLNTTMKKASSTYFVTDNPSSFNRLGREFFGHSVGSAKRLRFESL
jgi:glutamate racemase